MNCSVSIPPYFYFSQIISFLINFPSSGLIFLYPYIKLKKISIMAVFN